jgi:peptidoglycan L-alanyl-D-glutamate endopeptidase CwlK
MASRKIEDLHPDLQKLCRQFLGRCQAAGLSTFLVCTYRSDEEQNTLYAQGRTAAGSIVTRAKAGQSAHNHTMDGKPAALAFDIGVLLNGKYDGAGKSDEWAKSGKIAEELGLEWYGNPKSEFIEMPHVSMPNWKSYK